MVFIISKKDIYSSDFIRYIGEQHFEKSIFYRHNNRVSIPYLHDKADYEASGDEIKHPRFYTDGDEHFVRSMQRFDISFYRATKLNA